MFKVTKITDEFDREDNVWKNEEIDSICLTSPTGNCQIASITKPYKLFRKDQAFFEQMLPKDNVTLKQLLLVSINKTYFSKLEKWRKDKIILSEHYINERGVNMVICLFKIK